ncbi:RNA polymerase II transcription factor B subunit 4 [Hyaloraphidium curvatum]|nr:RNA polymerase II transcription factor B subunit 4 [Hyaloraphidium curvatum]
MHRAKRDRASQPFHPMISGPTSEDDPSLLVTVLDVNAATWSSLERDLPPVLFQTVVDSVLIFANSFLACRHDNSLAIVAAMRDSSRLLHYTDEPESTEALSDLSRVPDSSYLRHWTLGDKISSRVRTLFAEQQQELQKSQTSPSPKDTTVALSGALSLALSHINKVTKVRDLVHVRSRILVISASSDAAEQYIPLMNCFFAAQKMAVPIDICRLGSRDSSMLQQAASISNGVYLRCSAEEALQKLLFAYLPDHYSRGYLRPIGNRNVDFRAACFCHRKVIDVGFVCSVCLSIFCEPPRDVCSTCGTKLHADRVSSK